jgi:hypothetical protein
MVLTSGFDVVPSYLKAGTVEVQNTMVKVLEKDEDLEGQAFQKLIELVSIARMPKVYLLVVKLCRKPKCLPSTSFLVLT